jgi:hypothetical protein
LKKYNEDTISRIIHFHSQTFLEQDQGEPRLKFRQPLYMTYTQEVMLVLGSSNNTPGQTPISGKAVDITSIVVCYKALLLEIYRR